MFLGKKKFTDVEDFITYIAGYCLKAKWLLATGSAFLGTLIHWQFSTSIPDNIACALFFGLLSMYLWGEKVELALNPVFLDNFSEHFPSGSVLREMAIDRLANKEFAKKSFEQRFCLELPGYHLISVSKKKRELSLQKSEESTDVLDTVKQPSK